MGITVIDSRVRFNTAVYFRGIGICITQGGIYGKDNRIIHGNVKDLPALCMGWERSINGDYTAEYISYAPYQPGIQMSDKSARAALAKIIIDTEKKVIERSQEIIAEAEKELEAIGNT